MTTLVKAINVQQALESLAACTVWYPGYKEAMRLVSKCIDTTRDRKDPSSAMLIGPTGVGKTRLCQMIEKQMNPINPIQKSDKCVRQIRHCVYIELPESATIKSLSLVMAKALNEEPRDYQSITTLETLIMQRLITMEVQLVIFDDFHHIAEKGRTKTKSSLCNWLIKLMNNSGIPFIVSGSTGAEATINIVQELSDRFPYRARLKILPLAEDHSNPVLLGILAGLQLEMIRLGELKNHISLTEPYHYKAIYLATQGNFRRLSILLHDSFKIALIRGDHTLTISDFANAADDLEFCCSPNYFRMTSHQVNNALKARASRLIESKK
jgi:hypothetical protein